MIPRPELAFLDNDFIAQAGLSVLVRSIVIALLIMVVFRIIDRKADPHTLPPLSKEIARGMLAFCVPFVILLSSAWASAMPATYRKYGDGVYTAGKTIPANSYVVFPSGAKDKNGQVLPATVEITRGSEHENVSWQSGSMSVTLKEGDVMTISNGIARNRTISLTVNPDAPTSAIASGSAFLVGGATVCPGTYELMATGDDSEYELRSEFLQIGEPLNPEKLDGMGYVDIHFGDVLYLKNATATLYSTVFPARSSETETTEETMGPVKPEDAAVDEMSSDKKDSVAADESQPDENDADAHDHNAVPPAPPVPAEADETSSPTAPEASSEEQPHGSPAEPMPTDISTEPSQGLMNRFTTRGL